jgi:hypothetical protein
MKLCFENSKGVERVIGNPTTCNEADAIIKEFLVEHDYKSYCWNVNAQEDKTVVDVGSHTEFFILYKEDN